MARGSGTLEKTADEPEECVGSDPEDDNRISLWRLAKPRC